MMDEAYDDGSETMEDVPLLKLDGRWYIDVNFLMLEQGPAPSVITETEPGAIIMESSSPEEAHMETMDSSSPEEDEMEDPEDLE